MPILTYDDVKPRNYVNTTPVGALGGQDLVLQDVATAGILGKLTFIDKGQKSSGKTQLMRDIYNSYFNGEDHALWEMGRSDFRPRDLFEKLNITLAKGQATRMPEITTVYDNGKLRHFTRAYDPTTRQPSAILKEITKQEADSITKECSTTSADITELMNTDKSFFCIDEYNRCPEVVMNLFYSLMTGEINHQGKIIRLGGRFYSGMAAVNPEDYSGTFKMDAAMWARFHVALDFDAYRISAKDKDELTRRNLSPDVHPSETRDLLPQITALHESIKAKIPTLEERIILQYLQTGLDTCTKHSQSKETICWPKPCFTEGCKKATNTCGLLKGLDQRAIRAVYRLAKGLEEVARIKSGNQNLDIDTLDSLMLAYSFVAPYKGCINPKITKEKNGIETLVIKEHLEPIKTELSDKLNKFREMAEKDSKTRMPAGSSLERLRGQMSALGIASQYDAIEVETRKKYTLTRKITMDELKEQQPQILENKTKDMLKEEITSNTASYESAILDHLKKKAPNALAKMAPLKNGLSKEEFKKLQASGRVTKDLKAFNKELRDAYDKAVADTAKLMLDKLTPEEITSAFSVGQKVKDSISKKIEKDLLNKELEYVPQDKEPLFKQELARKLREAVRSQSSDASKQEREKLCSEEFKFLEGYYEEALEKESK